MMDEAGTFPTSAPPRRWNLGAESPVADPLADLPPALRRPLELCAAGPAEVLPDDYGDPDGLWLTVRRHNPFDVLLLERHAQPSLDRLLVRFRVLWKFWSQKLNVSRQGATRTAIRQKYGDDIESYVDNLQWAYDQLSAQGGGAFWCKRLAGQRAQQLWARVGDGVDATLADGLLDVAEVLHLVSRAEFAGYEREEFAVALRDMLHMRRFEPEVAPTGNTESARLASVRWATPEVWTRVRAAAAAANNTSPPAERYYVRIARTANVLGPLTAQRVNELIGANEITAAESICVVGAAVWQPIIQSRYGYYFRQQVAGHACPRCSHALTFVVESSAGGWAMVVLGSLTLAIYVGVIPLIVGIVMLVRRKAPQWRCIRCGYST